MRKCRLNSHSHNSSPYGTFNSYLLLTTEGIENENVIVSSLHGVLELFLALNVDLTKN